MIEGLPTWAKITGYLMGLLITGLVTTGLNQVFIEELQARLNSGGHVVNSNDTLTHEEKTELYQEGVENELAGIRDTLYQNIDSAYMHFEVLYEMLSRPSSEMHAIGFRSKKDNDTTWYRGNNGEQYKAWDQDDLFAKQYYDPSCHCFRSTLNEMRWDEYKAYQLGYIQRLIENQ